MAPELDLEQIAERARSLLEPEAPLVDMLLDQRVACGLGNVYKSEVLFIAQRPPHRCLAAVGDRELLELYATGRRLLLQNLGGGPRITPFADDRAERLWVYRRWGRSCLCCLAKICYGRMGHHLRSTYWCPACQDHVSG